MKRLISLLMALVLLTSGVTSMTVSASSLGGITEISDFGLTDAQQVELEELNTEDPIDVILKEDIAEPSDPTLPIAGENTELPAEEEKIEEETEEKEDEENEEGLGADLGGYMEVDLPFPGDTNGDVNAQFSMAAIAASSLPSSWDNRSALPPVRDQGWWGSCWTFSAITSAEATLRRNYSGAYGTNASNSISAYHMARFFYNTPNDPLGNIAGSRTIPRINGADIGSNDTRYLNIGGNNMFNTWNMAGWRAGGAEANSPYGSIDGTKGILPDSLAYNNIARLQNAYWINLSNRTLVKQMVQQHTAVSMAYYDTGRYHKTGNGTAHYQSAYTSANHAVAIVGWNDNYSRNNFNPNNLPPGNGAWLVRNSWGSNWGDGGYFWLSYHDTSISSPGKWGFVFQFEPSNNYRNIYQYDGSNGIRSSYINPGGSASSIFKTQGGAQRLDAVSVGVYNDNVPYNVQIYLNPSAGNPTSGTPMLRTPQAGTLPYVGYHTIRLNTPVNLPANSTFSVVITYPQGVYQFIDASYNNSNWIRFVNPSPAGRTFFRTSATASWQDFGRQSTPATARIKAFTNPAPATNPTPPAPGPNNPSPTPTPGTGTTVFNGVDYKAVYNFQYYIDRNPDVRAVFGNNQQEVLAHFVNHGMREGRQASANFNVTSYRFRYQDLRRTFGSNTRDYYMHYINFGQKEGRVATGTTTLQSPVTTLNGVNYSSVYSYQYYSTRYPDLVKAFGTDDFALLNHFINYGMKEGRQASANFNVTSYRLKYQDLRRAFGNNLPAYYRHFINSGQKEGRIATGTTTLQNPVVALNGINYSAVYNFNAYSNSNTDIRKVYGLDDFALLNHFINEGMKEGRQASPNFNVYKYRNRYPDLQKAFGNNLQAYYMHFITFGQKEGRIGN